jgi:hypothetical protein
MSWLYGKKSTNAKTTDSDSGEKRPRSNESTYQYVEKRGEGDWVVLQKGTGVVLSHHSSKREAEASFRAMEANKHG